MSCKGNSAEVSVSYEETKGKSRGMDPGKKTPSFSPTHVESGQEREEVCPSGGVASYTRKQPPTCDGKPGRMVEHREHHSLAQSSRDPRMRPQRAETVYVKAERDCFKGTGLEVRLNVEAGSDSVGEDDTGRQASRQGSNTGISRSRENEHRHARSVSNQGANRATISISRSPDSSKTIRPGGHPTRLRHPTQSRRRECSQGTPASASLEEVQPARQKFRAGVPRRNEKSGSRRKEGHGHAAPGDWGDEEREGSKTAKTEEISSWVAECETIGRENCFHDNHTLRGKSIVDEKDEARGHHHGDSRREHGPEKVEEYQRRWRNRGKILWNTHAESAARMKSGSPRHLLGRNIHPGPQTAGARPYHGLYERSLQANGIKPSEFRASRYRCCGDGNDRRCGKGHGQIDGSLLWRSSRGGRHTRAPSDGHPDRLESGRILDSLNRRAEIMGTNPPTPLRAKTAWMENPGDPSYR